MKIDWIKLSIGLGYGSIFCGGMLYLADNIGDNPTVQYLLFWSSIMIILANNLAYAVNNVVNSFQSKPKKKVKK